MGPRTAAARGVSRRCWGALNDEKHPEHEMYCEWIPVGYDPARFDLDEINDALARLDTGALNA